jgi:hypothetical protein
VRHHFRRLESAQSIDLRDYVRFGVLFVPFVVVPVVIRACWRLRHSADTRYVGLTAFAVAGLVGVLPRPGVNHFVATLPLTAAAALGIWVMTPGRLVTRAWTRWLAYAAGALVAVVGVSAMAASSAESFGKTRALHDVPHFRVTPIRADVEKRTQELRAALAAQTSDRVFIAREDAGFLYLRTGTRNPLPFDMVERSDFGAAGERGVIRRLERGDARWVCLHPHRPPKQEQSSLVPRQLEQWVRTHFEFVSAYPGCDLYRATAGSDTGPRA